MYELRAPGQDSRERPQIGTTPASRRKKMFAVPRFLSSYCASALFARRERRAGSCTWHVHVRARDVHVHVDELPTEIVCPACRRSAVAGKEALTRGSFGDVRASSAWTRLPRAPADRHDACEQKKKNVRGPALPFQLLRLCALRAARAPRRVVHVARARTCP